MVVSLVIGGVLLAAIVGISIFGAVTLPPEAQIPVHYGIGSFNNWMPKTIGLITWPAISALVFVVIASVSSQHKGSGPVIIAPIVMLVIMITQIGAIRASIGRLHG